MLGFLLLSLFLVVFLPSCACQGPLQHLGSDRTGVAEGSGLCWESRAAFTWKQMGFPTVE